MAVILVEETTSEKSLVETLQAQAKRAASKTKKPVKKAQMTNTERRKMMIGMARKKRMMTGIRTLTSLTFPNQKKEKAARAKKRKTSKLKRMKNSKTLIYSTTAALTKKKKIFNAIQ